MESLVPCTVEQNNEVLLGIVKTEVKGAQRGYMEEDHEAVCSPIAVDPTLAEMWTKWQINSGDTAQKSQSRSETATRKSVNMAAM